MYSAVMSAPMTPTRKLAGRAELRKLLGVSATRTVQITEQPDFPAPLDSLTMGLVWAMDDITAWAKAKGRTLHIDSLNTGPV
jgi:hypothetical protein